MWRDVKEHEVTPESVFESRRTVIKQLVAGGMLASGTINGWAQGAGGKTGSTVLDELAALPASRNSKWAVMDKPTDPKFVTSYNNFYEFGTDKSEPARYADTLKTRPWTVVVEGECLKPRTFAIEDLLKFQPMEERIYRFRCVEAWSMVVPWIGYPLSALLKAVEPTGKAKYVAFETLADKRQMPGLRSPVLDWPYVEGLRLDEAMHDLTLLTFGQYGKLLPNQSGAPVRLVVPWKYGFKSIKSIVRIRLTEKQPPTSWNVSAPREYGFYSNVNPTVDHPRWSQASERKLGEGAFGGLVAPRKKTELFNGYADSVASLYTGMDLAKFF